MQHVLRYSTLPTPTVSRELCLAFLRMINLWRCRCRMRRELASLDDRALADIGLTRADQWCECRKPFWRT
jgi:uncharacterized protein YjiS (DUF1127 family)